MPFDDWDLPVINESCQFSSIIVIPSYCESKYIIETLNSLNEQSDFDLRNLLVILVVNNGINDSRLSNNPIKLSKNVELAVFAVSLFYYKF